MARRKTKTDAEIAKIIASVPMSDKSKSDMTLSYADHQFLARLMTTRDEATKEELKEFLLEVYEKDNETLCSSVTAAVCKEMEEFMVNTTNRLASLGDGQEKIMQSLDSINERLNKIEDRVFVTDEKRLIRLEKYASWTQTIARGAVYVILAVILASVLIWERVNNKVSRIERLLEQHVKIEAVE